MIFYEIHLFLRVTNSRLIVKIVKKGNFETLLKLTGFIAYEDIYLIQSRTSQINLPKLIT